MEDLGRVEVSDPRNAFLVEESGLHRSIQEYEPFDEILGVDNQRIGPQVFRSEIGRAFLGSPKMNRPQSAAIPVDQAVGRRVSNMSHQSHMLRTGRVCDQCQSGHLGLHHD